MPLPDSPHVAKLTVLWTNTYEGNKCESVFYLRDTTDEMFIAPTATCDLVWTAVVDCIVPNISAAVVFNGVGFEDVRTFPFGGVEVPETATPGTSSVGGAQLPSSVSLAIKKSTATLGRSGRGRWFWPVGQASNLVEGNTVASASAAAWVGGLEAFQAQIESTIAPAEMGINSYYSGKVLRSTALFSRITGWGVTDLNVDSQRRRLPGRGQ